MKRNGSKTGSSLYEAALLSPVANLETRVLWEFYGSPFEVAASGHFADSPKLCVWSMLYF